MRALIASLFAVWGGPAAAFCGTYVSSPGVELTNQTSQIIIARQGERTTLTMANDYDGPLSDFAMLIPVPYVLDEDDIQTARPELFQRFNDYSAPRIVEYECSDFEWDYDYGGMDGGGMSTGGMEGGWEEAPSVTVEATYSVGIYEVVILSATESSGLISWLDENGYGVDSSAEELLAEYIEAGQKFFAAKVDGEALSVDEDGSTTLEPLQFGYESSAFSLPIRLGTLNSPGFQDVVMYIVTDEDDGSVGISNYTQFTVEDECMVDFGAEGSVDAYYGEQFSAGWDGTGTGEGWLQEYAWATSSCDPCPTENPTNDELEEAGYEGETWDSYFTRIRLRYTPEAATEEVMLYTSGIRDREQIRYIVYNSEMEDREPVCGWGMVADPGTCDDEEPGTDVWDEPESDGDTDGGDEGGDEGGALDGGTDGGESDGSEADISVVDDEDSDASEDKGGCSHVDASSMRWAWLLGVAALFGRRRQTEQA